MKLQIIPRQSRRDHLSQNDSRMNLQSAILAKTAVILDKDQPAWPNHRTRDEQSCYQRPHVRDFFDNFSQNCRVQYISVPSLTREWRRKIEFGMNILICSAQKQSCSPNNIFEKNAIPITFCLGECQPVKGQNTAKILKIQNPRQRLRKIVSLSSFPQLNANHSLKTKQDRKPGFIRLYKSRCCSLQTSKIAQAKKKIHSNNSIKIDLAPVSKTGSFSQSVLQSKERISKIRRELTEIYRMRQNNVQHHLKLQ